MTELELELEFTEIDLLISVYVCTWTADVTVCMSCLWCACDMQVISIDQDVDMDSTGL